MDYVDSNELKACQVTDLWVDIFGVELLMMWRKFLEFSVCAEQELFHFSMFIQYIL